MDSIAIGWKKQTASKGVRILNRQPRSQKRVTQKVLQKKPQNNEVQIVQIPQTIRSNTVLVEKTRHTPLPTSNNVRKSAVNLDHVIQVPNTNGFCSTRAAVATFIIVIIIIALAGAAIGIVFAAIKSQSSSSNGNDSANNNNNQNSLSTASTSLLTSSISIGSQIGLPCLGYTEINDPTRNYSYTGSSNACDNGPLFNTSDGGSWIRFSGSGGTNLPLVSPGLNHCGGFLTSWFNDTLTPPSPVNTIRNGTVCFETYAHICGVTVDISLAYCSGGYYVYFLPPIPICNARYCTA